MVRVREILALGACAALLAGCSTAKADLPGITGSPAVTASSPEPEPSPTERTATDLSDPDGLGIVFVDTPDLEGPAASAHDAVAIYWVEYWRSSTTGVVSPALAPLTSPDLLRKVEHGIQQNNERDFGYDGVLRVTISDVVVDGTSATAAVCLDFADVLFSDADGSSPKSFTDIDAPQYERSTMRLSTVDDGVTWRPEDGAFEGTAC